MIRPERLFVDGDRPLAQWLCLSVARHGPVQLGQVVERGSKVWMIRPERLFVDGDRPLVQKLGLGVAPGGGVHQGQMVEAYADGHIVGA
jgi:hypothetical protein